MVGRLVAVFFRDARPPGPADVGLHALITLVALGGCAGAALLLWRGRWAGLLVAVLCLIPYAVALGPFFSPELYPAYPLAGLAPCLVLADRRAREWLFR